VRIPVLLATCALTALAGCTGQENFIVWGSSSGPTSPNLPFDGLWKGGIVRQAQGTPCLDPQRGTFVVGDGRIVVAYQPNLTLVSAIASDGAFHAAAGDSVLDGKLVDDTLNFSVTTKDCETQYAFNRVIGM